MRRESVMTVFNYNWRPLGAGKPIMAVRFCPHCLWPSEDQIQVLGCRYSFLWTDTIAPIYKCICNSFFFFGVFTVQFFEATLPHCFCGGYCYSGIPAVHLRHRKCPSCCCFGRLSLCCRNWYCMVEFTVSSLIILLLTAEMWCWRVAWCSISGTFLTIYEVYNTYQSLLWYNSILNTHVAVRK